MYFVIVSYSYAFGDSGYRTHVKEQEKEKNMEKLNVISFPIDVGAIEIYKQFFPQFTPSPFQQDIIEQTVTDADKWTETCKFWALNDYRPQSIGKMLEYYETNGTNKQSYRQQRADEARLSAQRESEIRERVERRKAELSGGVVSDNPRLLSAVEPITD